MSAEAELIDRDGTNAAGACDRRSTSPPPGAATPGWQRLAIPTSDHHLPHVVPRPGAETVPGSALLSLREVSRESMVDEREADLIRRVLLGDVGAYDVILTPHLPVAWRLAYSQLRDRCGAEDCVQEAALRGWRRLENLKPGRPFRPWFLGIVVRRCQEARRSRWMTAVLLVDPGRVQSSDDDWLEGHLQGAELRRAFASLRRNDQVAIYLHFVEDLPQAEVAETLGVGLANVKSRINRAKKRLRAALEEER
jgi:RNA polymerase sigma-70 factor, ECF subfamily